MKIRIFTKLLALAVFGAAPLLTAQIYTTLPSDSSVNTLTVELLDGLNSYGWYNVPNPSDETFDVNATNNTDTYIGIIDGSKTGTSWTGSYFINWDASTADTTSWYVNCNYSNISSNPDEGCAPLYTPGGSSLSGTTAGTGLTNDTQDDLRTLQNLYWFKTLHSPTTHFDSAISRVECVVEGEWNDPTQTKGWQYFTMLRLMLNDTTTNDTCNAGSPSGTSGQTVWQENMAYWAENMYYQINSKSGGLPVIHGSIAAYTGGPSIDDGFDIPYQLEIGAALIDASYRFAGASWLDADESRDIGSWAATGYNLIDDLYSGFTFSVSSGKAVSGSTYTAHPFSSTYNLFGRMYGFINGSGTTINQIWDTEVEPTDVAESLDAILRTIYSAPVNNSTDSHHSTYLTLLTTVANAELGGFVTAGTSHGFHDSTYGGYYNGFYVGTQYDGSYTAGQVNSGGKDGRETQLLDTFHLANTILGSNWTSLESEMLGMTYYSNADPAGYSNTDPDTNHNPGMLFTYTDTSSPATLNGFASWLYGYSYEVETNYTPYSYRCGTGTCYQPWISTEATNIALLGLQEWQETVVKQ